MPWQGVALIPEHHHQRTAFVGILRPRCGAEGREGHPHPIPALNPQPGTWECSLSFPPDSPSHSAPSVSSWVAPRGEEPVMGASFPTWREPSLWTLLPREGGKTGINDQPQGEGPELFPVNPDTGKHQCFSSCGAEHPSGCNPCPGATQPWGLSPPAPLWHPTEPPQPCQILWQESLALQGRDPSPLPPPIKIKKGWLAPTGNRM